jgi:uncharacterized protein YbjQ (UPF0145 family)
MEKPQINNSTERSIKAPNYEQLKSILSMSDENPKAIVMEAMRRGFVISGVPMPAGPHIQYGPVFASGLRVVDIIRSIGEAIQQIIGGRLKNQERTEQATFYEVLARLIKDAIKIGGNAIYGFSLQVNQARRESYVSAHGYVVKQAGLEQNYAMDRRRSMRSSVNGQVDMYGMQKPSKPAFNASKNKSNDEVSSVDLLLSGIALAA